MKNTRICEECKVEVTTAKDSRFCKECTKVLLLEMQGSGYLQKRPGPGSFRSSESRENIYETKHGRDG